MKLGNRYLNFFQLIYLLVNALQFLVVMRPEIFSARYVRYFTKCGLINLYRHVLVMNVAELIFKRIRRRAVCADTYGINPYTELFGNFGSGNRRDGAHVVHTIGK